MIGAYRAGEPLADPEAMRPYWVAKRCADDFLEASSLDATILRPTALTDDEGTGRVSASFECDGEGGDDTPRTDVVQAVVAALETEPTIGETIRLFGGDTAVEDAVRPEH